MLSVMCAKQLKTAENAETAEFVGILVSKTSLTKLTKRYYVSVDFSLAEAINEQIGFWLYPADEFDSNSPIMPEGFPVVLTSKNDLLPLWWVIISSKELIEESFKRLNELTPYDRRKLRELAKVELVKARMLNQKPTDHYQW